MTIKTLLILLIVIFIQLPAYATCSKSYTVGFFNGVWNTYDQATTGRSELKKLIGDTYNNEPIKYEAFYNHTGTSVGATSLQDLAETFIQRANEIDKSGQMGKRFEYFWEFLGSSEPTFLDKLAGFLPNAASLFDSVYTAITTKLVSIVSLFLSNSPTETDYAAHNARLDALATDGEKLMLVGHSQGNLFMNHAYDHILPVVTKDRIAAAHIAPASPTLRGDYVLANIDAVINLMRVQGITSVPENNLPISFSSADVSGHTLIGTYLDGTRDGRGCVKTMIETGMGTLKCSYIQETITTIIVYTASGYGFRGDCNVYGNIPYLSNVPEAAMNKVINDLPYAEGDIIPPNFYESYTEESSLYFLAHPRSCSDAIYIYYMIDHVINHTYIWVN